LAVRARCPLKWAIGVAFAVLVVAALAACQDAQSPPEQAARSDATRVPSEADATTAGSPRGTALAVLDALPVKGRAPRTGYDRERFGGDWVSVDGCDMGERILARDLRREMYEPGSACEIQRGRLADPYTAASIDYVRGGASEVDVDHVVALGDAWQKGAQQWQEVRRVEFANDPLNLLAVDASANRQKADGDAATWLPSNTAFRCAYVARQIAVKRHYGIWVTSAERDAMRRVLTRCPAARLPAGGRAQVPTPTPTPRSDVFANCDAVRAAGKAPLRRGDPAYTANRHLDRDDDGVACEP
jgi:Excalibur calcium-binding domain/Protein of unknown function (DUF1524)